jgi:hypothetical protein
MKHLSELETTLSHFFDWNKARLNCLVQILQALFAVRTVNLTQIAAAFHRRQGRVLLSQNLQIFHGFFF